MALFTIYRKTPRKGGPESRRALVVSVVVHVLVGVGLVELLLMPSSLRNWMGLGKDLRPKVEQIRYVNVAPTPLPASRGPVQPTPPPPAPAGATPTPTVAPPTTVPTTIAPPPPEKPAEPPETAVGPVADRGGPGAGAKVEYWGKDKGIWRPAAPPGAGEKPRSLSARLDSSVRAMVGPVADSMVLASGRRKPGDWTIGKDGHKWGIDDKFIHLGPVELPTPLLAMLPLNRFSGGNPADADERLINTRGKEINYFANRGIDEQEFNKAVKDERLRKEREHQEQQKQRKDQKDQPTDKNPPPVQ